MTHMKRVFESWIVSYNRF